MATNDYPALRLEYLVPDDSIAPLVPKGRRALIDTELDDIRDGDGILVEDAEGALLLRLYRSQGAGSWEAYALQPGVDALEARKHGLSIVGVFVGSIGRMCDDGAGLPA